MIGTNQAHFNRIVGNNLGIQYGSSINAGNNATIDVENNWWGCNFGPGAGGAGCTGTTNGTLVFAGNTGVLDADPWLVLGISASPNTVPVDGSSTSNVVANLTMNSNALASGGFVPNGTQVAFSSTLGTIAPPTSTTASGLANAIYTGTTVGVGSASSTVDAQIVSTPITVLAAPTIGKAFGALSVALNGSTTLTITLGNTNTGNTLSGVSFTDALPLGLLVATPNGLVSTCGGTPSAPAGGSSVGLSGVSIAASSSCTFTVNVTGTTAGTKSNTTTAVTSSNGGTGGTASATLEVVAPPTIGKVFGASSIALNGTTTMTITLGNPNTANTLTGVSFTDALPAGLLVATPNGLVSSCGGTPAAPAGGSSVGVSGVSLTASASCTFTVDVTGTTAGPKSNTTAAVTSSNGGTGGTATATIDVVAPPTIGKAFGAAAINLGATTSLTFTLTNPAANTVALTAVGFTDGLPTGLVVATPNGLTGSCGGGSISAAAGSGSVSLSGATLAVGSSCTFSVDVTGTTPGTKPNTTSAVTSSNGGTGTVATASITVLEADLTITKSHVGNFLQGGTGTYSIVASNSGPGPTSGTVTVTDTLPSGLTATSIGGTGWACTLATLTCTRSDTLASGASYPTITLTVNVSNTTTGTVTNTATISGGGNVNTANDTASDVTIVDINPTIPALGPIALAALVLLLMMLGVVALKASS